MHTRLLRMSAAILLAIGALGAAGASQVDLRGTARTAGRPEPNAVIWLEAPHAPATAQKQKAVLHQRSLAFAPHVLAIQVGTTVDFPNEDRVFHNVFSFRDGKRFDLGLYPVGSTKQVHFSEPGTSRLFCNIHPNMAGYVVVVDSPYVNAADKGGVFTIPSVLPGTYTWHAWRPGGPALKGSVVVQPGAALDIAWP